MEINWTDNLPTELPLVTLSSDTLDSSPYSILRAAELRELHESTTFVIQKIVTPVVVLAGCLGNTINIAVLTRSWMKSSSNCYLTALVSTT